MPNARLDSPRTTRHANMELESLNPSRDTFGPVNADAPASPPLEETAPSAELPNALPDLPSELVTIILQSSLAPPDASNGSSWCTALFTYALVSRVWCASAQALLFQRVALPDPLHSWQFTTAVQTTALAMELATAVKEVVVGRPPQEVLGGTGAWWLASGPRVSADAYEQALRMVWNARSICLSGLMHLDVCILHSFLGARSQFES